MHFSAIYLRMFFIRKQYIELVFLVRQVDAADNDKLKKLSPKIFNLLNVNIYM